MKALNKLPLPKIILTLMLLNKKIKKLMSLTTKFMKNLNLMKKNF